VGLESRKAARAAFCYHPPAARRATGSPPKQPLHSSDDRLRIWLLPLSILTGACLTVFVLTYWADASSHPDPGRVLDLIIRPNPEAAANTLANAGEIVAAVLAIALTVVAIIVELASNRYTHRVTELFVGEPVNFAVMGLFVVTALQGMWVTLTFDPSASGGGFVPYVGIGVSMALLTTCLLILLPYFSYVFSYLNPIRIVQRIYRHTLAGIERGAHERSGRRGTTVEQRQAEAVRGVEQLADVAANAMHNRDKGVSMAAVDALGDLLRDYQEVRERLPDAWFVVGGELAHNPDFVSMDAEVLADVSADRVWFEMKVLRQYQMVYAEALNRMRDVACLVAIDTRRLGEAAAAREQQELLGLTMKFFNTYVRFAINAKDVRTAYNIFHQYRMLASHLLERGDSAHAVEIASYFKYYGLLAYQAHLPFVLETVAYDLCTLTELAHERQLPATDRFLRILLRVDRESEGAVQEASLRGVRKAQVKAATGLLLRGDEARARRVFADMADEDPGRLASIRDELSSISSPEYWEIIDRGQNLDYLSGERKEMLDRFFSWFPNLPTRRSSQLGWLPTSAAEPGPDSLVAIPAISADESSEP